MERFHKCHATVHNSRTKCFILQQIFRYWEAFYTWTDFPDADNTTPPHHFSKKPWKINNQRKSTVRRNNIYFQHFTEASERVRKCEKSTTKKKRRFFLPLHHMPVYSSICIFRLENVFRVPVQAHSLNLSRLHIHWVWRQNQRWNG